MAQFQSAPEDSNPDPSLTSVTSAGRERAREHEGLQDLEKKRNGTYPLFSFEVAIKTKKPRL